jgi:hypothetical protein
MTIIGDHVDELKIKFPNENGSNSDNNNFRNLIKGTM